VAPALAEQHGAAAGQRPLQHPPVHRMRGLSMAPSRSRLRMMSRRSWGSAAHPRHIGAGQPRIGPQHGEHHKLRGVHAKTGPAIVPESAAWRPGAAADRRGSPVRRACPSRRRRSAACEIRILRAVFRAARGSPRCLGRAWFCRASNLAHDISALITSERYIIRQ